MYAQLCKRLSLEAPNFEVNNDSFCTFLRLLVNVCRDKFENRAIYCENIINSSSVLTDEDEEKKNIAKQKMLGNVKFIGEIFKLDMLGETHLHKMLQSLLHKDARTNQTLDARCDDMECLAQILKTCGKQLDALPGKSLMDQYFEHLDRKIQMNSRYPARIRFLLRDVIELRQNNWIPRKRTDGPVPMQDLNTDEDIIRASGAGSYLRQREQQRKDERDWMSKLPLNLQSTGFNDVFGSLSVSNTSMIPPFSSQQNNSYNSRNESREMGNNGGGGGNSGGPYNHHHHHRNYNNSNASGGGGGNPRNHHQGHNSYSNNNGHPRYNKHNNPHHSGGQSQSSHGSYGSSAGGGHHHQNNHNIPNTLLNNKDNIAPRFKRNLMTPAAQPSGDELQMRPTQNSLLYKASQQMSNKPLPMQPPHQQNHHYQHRGGNNGSGSETNGHYHQGQAPPQNLHHQAQQWSHRSNPSPPLQSQMNNSHVSENPPMTLQSQPNGNSSVAKSANGKPIAVVAPTASTPINNILKKDDIIIKPAGGEKAAKKEKKDKGPNKEDFLKKVNAFLNENLLDEGLDFIERENGVKENGTEEKSEAKTMEDVVGAFMELKVPDKFMRDSITKILLEILDKNDALHDRIITFLLTLRKENRVSNGVISEALKNVVNAMNEKEKTIPKITTIVASLLCRAVVTNLCKLSDIAAYTENGQHYPLFLLVLQQLHKKMGQQELCSLFTSSKVNLMTTLPEVDRTKDRMAEILEDRKLSFLYPLLRVQAELWKQIQADPNPQQFYKWIKENIEAHLYTDPGFITAMMTVVVKHITKNTTVPDGFDSSKLPDKISTDKEKDLLEKYSPVMNAFLNGHIDLQLIAIYALQVYCFSVNFPKGMLLRWFTTLYELNVIDEDAYFRWKEDITDIYPGKGQALFQVNAYLTYLEEAESEEEDEEE